MSPPTPFTHLTQSFQKDCSLCSESSLLLLFLSPHQEFGEDVSISSTESPLQDWLRFFSSSFFYLRGRYFIYHYPFFLQFFLCYYETKRYQVHSKLLVQQVYQVPWTYLSWVDIYKVVMNMWKCHRSLCKSLSELLVIYWDLTVLPVFKFQLKDANKTSLHMCFYYRPNCTVFVEISSFVNGTETFKVYKY